MIVFSPHLNYKNDGICATTPSFWNYESNTAPELATDNLISSLESSPYESLLSSTYGSSSSSLNCTILPFNFSLIVYLDVTVWKSIIASTIFYAPVTRVASVKLNGLIIFSMLFAIIYVLIIINSFDQFKNLFCYFVYVFFSCHVCAETYS